MFVQIMAKEITLESSKSEQFYHESMTWERLLEFFKQENTILKNRLSEVLDSNANKDFLALAEHFQNLFIIRDELIDELRREISVQQSVLKKGGASGVERNVPKLIKLQEKLRNEMEYLEKDFANVKNDFNKHLASVL